MVGPSLSLFVLHTLASGPQTGYSLVKAIERSTGQKPSFGSIYPILEKLTHEGILAMKVDGRKKVYTLTPKGKRSAADLKTRHEELLGQMIAQSRMFCQVTGCDPAPMVAMLERLKRGDDPLAGVSSNALALRDTLFTLSQDDRIKRHRKEINAILKDAVHRLERLH
jgi:DNA-binding PadR family transcriptional regulator